MTSFSNIKKSINGLFSQSKTQQKDENEQSKSQKPQSEVDEKRAKKISKTQKQSTTSKNDNKQTNSNLRNQSQTNNNVITYLKWMFFQQQVQCGICLRVTKKSSMVGLCICEHQYCNQCVKNYLNSKLAAFSHIKCLQQPCQAKINQQTIFYKALPPKLKQGIDKILKFHFTSNDPHLKLCPTQDCQGILALVQGAPVLCSLCHKQFCRECFYLKHQGKCAKNQVNFLSVKYKFRKCKQCDIIVEKIQACNHITCRCGYEFCYGCGRKWTRNDHFCPQFRINSLNAQGRRRCGGRQDQSIIKRAFRLIGQFILTILLFSCTSIYVIICLFPMLSITLITGLIFGMTLYAVKYIIDVCKLNDARLGFLLIILFPIAMMCGVGQAFKGFWGQSFRFWCELLADTIERTLDVIWA